MEYSHCFMCPHCTEMNELLDKIYDFIIILLCKFYFQEYLETDPSGRDPDDVQVILVKQANEPLNFAGHFPAWDWDRVSID